LAFKTARQGVPGVVFIEYPLDVIWPRSMSDTIINPPNVKQQGNSLNRDAIIAKLQHLYLKRHFENVHRDAFKDLPPLMNHICTHSPPQSQFVLALLQQLSKSVRPVLVIGSQAIRAGSVLALQSGLSSLGVPIYLSGMARGLMGRNHPLQMRHQRGVALAKADFVLLAGVPCDFRLNYGRSISRAAFLTTINLSSSTLSKNTDIRRPNLRVLGDSLSYLLSLAQTKTDSKRWAEWTKFLTAECQKKRRTNQQNDPTRNGKFSKRWSAVCSSYPPVQGN